MKPILNIFQRNTTAPKTAESGNAAARGNKYGEQIVSTLNQFQFGVEGSAYSVTTPTPGTGIALTIGAQTTFNALAPALLIRNSGSTALDADLIMRRLRLICTATGTALTSLESAIVIDTANRYTSGGLPMTPNNNNTSVSTPSNAQVYNASTAIVAAAVGAGTRIVNRSKVRTGIPVVGDEYVFNFGAEPTPETGAISGTAAARFGCGLGPVVIAPGGTFLFYLWGPSQTGAPSYELTLEYVER